MASPKGGAYASNDSMDEVPHAHSPFAIPSPVPTRRNRTCSQVEKALKAPELKGVIKSFCRHKGHGFITPNNSPEPLFVHISDIEGEFVPKEGDEVSFRTVFIPPRYEKRQACHVVITHLNAGVKHEKWNSPVPRDVDDC